MQGLQRQLLLFLLLTTFSTAIYGQSIFPTLDGQELIDSVKAAYKPSSVPSSSTDYEDIIFGEIYKDAQDSLYGVYTDLRIYIGTTSNPSSPAGSAGFNIEHTWPKRFGAGGGNANKDMHHLTPVKSSVNNARGNYPFAEIDNADADTWYWKDFTTSSPFGDLGLWSRRNKDDEFFEPRDAHKGNIARAMFYFYTMYKDDVDDSEDPLFFDKHIPVLYQWHIDDPADSAEVARTWLIAAHQSGKPNPYVLDATLGIRAYYPDSLATFPLISGFSPDIGPAGTVVTISGSNFTSATDVFFNGTSASFTVLTDASIEATVPVGASSGTISVVNAGGTAISTNSFTITTPPFTLTIDTVGTGTVGTSPGGTSFGSVTDVTLTATPGVDHVFAGWSGDLSGNTNPIVLTVNDDKNVTATFAKVNTDSVVFEEIQTGSAESGLTVTTSTVLSAFSGHLYLAAISTVDHEPVISVSGLGLTWTLLESQCSGRNKTGVEVWMAQGSPTGNEAVTATFANDPTNALITVARYSGVSAADPIGVTVRGNTNGEEGSCSGGSDNSSYNLSLTPESTGTMIVALVATRTKTNTPGSGYTEQAETTVGSSGNKIGLALQDKMVSLLDPVAVNGSLSGSTDWAVIGLELKSGSSGTPQYTLATQTVGSGSVSLNPAGGTYDENTVVELTATADAGFEFTGWSGELSGNSNPDSVTMSGNKTVTATFTSLTPQYSLTTNISGSGTIQRSPDQALYDSSETVVLTATADSAYRFTGWSGVLSGSVNPDSVEMDSNTTVNATFIRQFKLTSTASGGGSINFPPIEAEFIYDSLTVITFTAVPDSGYRFAGWSGDVSGASLTDSVTMDSDRTVNALFVREYQLIANTAGNGAINFTPDTTGGALYDSATVVTMTAVPDSGYGFSGWSGGLSGTSNPDSIRMDSDKTVTASFTLLPTQFSLTTITNGHGSIVRQPDMVSYDSAATVTLTATADSAYRFTGWNGDLSGNSSPDSVTMDSNLVVTANFLRQFMLSGSVIGGGSVSFSPDTTGGGIYDSLTVVEMIATPDSGYRFAGWSGDVSGASLTDSVTMDSDRTVNALFIREYQLTANTSSNGVITFIPDTTGGALYDSATVVSLTAVPDSGYTFAGWSGGLSGVNNPDSITMDSDQTVTAAFMLMPTQFSLATTSNGAGSVLRQPDLASYDSAATVILTAEADSAYRFTSWSGDLSGSVTPDSVTMDSNLAVTANFVRQFVLSDSVIGGGSISFSPDTTGGGIYDSLTVVEMIAIPDSGYRFAGWSGDTSNTADTISVNMNTDKQVIATFIRQFTFTYSSVSNGTFTIDPDTISGVLLDSATTITLTANPDSSYSLDNWGPDLAGNENPYAFNLTADTHVEPAFIVPFTLSSTVFGNGSIELSPAGGSYAAGTVVTVTANSGAGASFAAWSGDLSGSNNPETITMDGNKNISATFGQSIVFEDVVGGTAGESFIVSTDSNVTAATDQLYLATISSKPHETISSVTGMGLTWTLVRRQCSARNHSMVEIWQAMGTPSGDDIVTATFNDEPDFSVIAVSRWSGVDTTTPLTEVFSGNTQGLNGSCSGSGSDNSAYSFRMNVPHSESIIFNAAGSRNKTHFPGTNFSEIFEHSSGSGSNQATLSLQYKPAPVTDSTDVDGSFSGSVDWSLAGLAIMPAGSSGPPGFTLNTPSSIGGSILRNPDLSSYSAGDTVAVTAVPDSGYVFSHWSGAISGSANPDSVVMDSSMTATANFIRRFLLSTNNNTGGSISISPDSSAGIYDSTTVVQLVATADSAYRFVGWSGDTTSNADTLNLTMNSDKNIQGMFIRQFHLSLLPALNGGISSTPDTSGGAVFDSATTITLTATPDSAYFFANWNSGPSGTDNPLVFSLESDTSVGASFSPAVQLTATAIGNGSVELSPAGGSYAPGTIVTVTAIPGAGGLFSSWAGDLSGSTNPETITMDTSKTISAIFNEEIYLAETVGGTSESSLIVSTDSVISAHNDHLYLATISSKPNETISTVTGLGLTWTLVRRQCSARNHSTVEIWQAIGTPTGAGVVTAVFSDAPSFAVIGVTRWSGVDTTVPITETISGNTLGLDGICDGSGSDNSSYIFRIAVPNFDGIIFNAVGSRNKIHTPGGQYSKFFDQSSGSGSNQATLSLQYKPAPVTDSTDVKGAFSGSVDWSMTALAIMPAGSSTPTQFTLNSSIVGSGSISFSPDTSGGALYDSASVVTVTALADSGWTFSGWSGDIIGTDSTDSLTMNSAKSITATFVANLPLRVYAKTFLEGPYRNGSMDSTLASDNLIPLTQPFNETPWLYEGTENPSALPANTIDWMLLELRSAPSPDSIVATCAAMILKDGQIADTAGAAGVPFPGIEYGDYYIVLKHRNHLSIMSATTVSLTDSNTVYDFSDNIAKAYGSTPMKELSSGVYGMIAGDANADGIIDMADRDSVWRFQNGTTWEYIKKADLNLDGSIDIEDLNLFWRSNLGSSSNVGESMPTAPASPGGSTGTNTTPLDRNDTSASGNNSTTLEE